MGVDRIIVAVAVMPLFLQLMRDEIPKR